MASEQQVQMAATLYDARRSARILLGESFKPKMAELGDALTTIAKAKGIDTLQAAILCARGASGMQAVQILAAAVELTEPT